MNDPSAAFAVYYELARNLYQTGPSHDFSHIERVFRLALRIGRAESADLRLLGTAALFHDLGREEEAQSDGEICHAAASAARARQILAEHGETPQFIAAVARCIARHRYRNDEKPVTLEEKCLFDADKLDSLGAVGVARAYLWLGERGGTVHVPQVLWEQTDFESRSPADDSLQREWHIKLRHIEEKLFTGTAREIARRRAATMENFLDTLEREVNGEE